MRLLELLLPEHWVGDLLEESAGRSGWWLARQVVGALVYAVRIRLERAPVLESAAATAFFVGMPLVGVLVLRGYALTLIPFRESAEYSWWAVAALGLLTAILAATLTRLLGRRWLPAVMATLVTAGIGVLLHAPWVMTVAAFAGGSLAMVRRRGGTA